MDLEKQRKGEDLQTAQLLPFQEWYSKECLLELAGRTKQFGPGRLVRKVLWDP